MLCATEHRVADTWSVPAPHEVVGRHRHRPRPARTPSLPGVRADVWREVGRHNHRPLRGPTQSRMGGWVRERVSEQVICKPRPGG